MKFSCVDSNGGPPTTEGEQAYIVVTDIKGLGITYFAGLVAVGQQFPVNDGNQRFEPNMFINIYTPDQSALVQAVQLHTSCPSNFELKNRFGASQLVEFYNDVQGSVSCFETFDFSVAIPVSMSGESITLTGLIAMTNFAGFVDLTSQVAGQTVLPGGSVTVTLQGTIDLTEQRRYTAMFTIEGTKIQSGDPCGGSELASFVAGNTPPPSFPTIMPSRSPAI